jgi:hypothetical protein
MLHRCHVVLEHCVRDVADEQILLRVPRGKKIARNRGFRNHRPDYRGFRNQCQASGYQEPSQQESGDYKPHASNRGFRNRPSRIGGSATKSRESATFHRGIRNRVREKHAQSPCVSKSCPQRNTIFNIFITHPCLWITSAQPRWRASRASPSARPLVAERHDIALANGLAVCSPKEETADRTRSTSLDGTIG